MKRKTDKMKFSQPKTKLRLPDLGQSKAAVLGSLRSPESQRGYRHAIVEFIEWYCSEPSSLSIGVTCRAGGAVAYQGVILSPSVTLGYQEYDL